MKKYFDFKAIKCPWLLAAAMLVFVLVLFVERYWSESVMLINMLWGVDVLLALAWAISNYVLRMKVHSAWGQQSSIEGFVARLSMGHGEKEELKQYLADFANDLESKGMTHDEAVQTAIAQFQVREFSETQPANLFEKQSHTYLLGCAVVLLAAAALCYLVNQLAAGVFVFAAASFALVVYGIALLFLFVLYHVLDALTRRK